MGILKVVVELIIFYILFRVVVNFIIPAYKNISKFKKQFNQMQKHFDDKQQNNYNQQKNFRQPDKKDQVSSTDDSEYIDFEEVDES